MVGAIGGLLGQLIITLAIIEKNFNRRLTSKSNVSKKSKSSTKSKKEKEKEAKDKKKEDDAEEAKSQGGKSGKSQGGKSAGGKSGKSEKGGETPAGEPAATITSVDPAAEPIVKEKGWFTKQNIQNFIFMFVSEKLPTEKLQLVVGHAYGKFISQM